MKETAILKALQAAAIAGYGASTLAALSGWTNDTRLKAIGRTFTPPNDGKYLEFLQIVNNRQGEYYGDERTYQGILRIILHWPNNNEGAYEPMTHLDSVADYFKKTRDFAQDGITVKIYGVPDAGGMISDGGELLFPLSLPYRCFVP